MEAARISVPLAVGMCRTEFDFCYFNVFWQVQEQKYDVIFFL